MDKMREEFESWYLKQVDDDDVESIDLWDAWKASRAALCVELPVIISCSDSACLLGYNNAVDDFKECLDLAGLSYK
ncbi:MAG: hypothetical protein ACRCYB_06645 [Aeromonas veronii]